MVDRLAGVPADVEDEPVPALPHSLLPGHRMRSAEETLEQAVSRHLSRVRQVPARHHEHVHGRLGIYVLEGDDLLVVEDDLRGRPAGRYLAEDAISHSSAEGTWAGCPTSGGSPGAPGRKTTLSS